MPPHPTSWMYIVILSSLLCLGLPSDLFPQVSPPERVCTSPISHTCHMPRLSHSSWFHHTTNKMPHNIVSPLPHYLLPLRLWYSPQHPILKHSQCEWQSFTPIQNNRQNYSSLYLNIYLHIFHFILIYMHINYFPFEDTSLSEMWCCVTRQVVPKISKGSGNPRRLPEHDGGGTIVLWNTGNFWPNSTVSHPRRLGSLAHLWEPQISHFKLWFHHVASLSPCWYGASDTAWMTVIAI